MGQGVNVLLMGLVALIAVIAVIGFAATLAMKILRGISEGVGTFSARIVDWLGRRSLGRHASIPEVLLVAPSRDRKTDPERKALERYAPTAMVLPGFETALFKGSMKEIFGPLPQPTRAMDIDEILDIRRMSAEPSFKPLWAVLDRECRYPVRLPSKPPDPPAPPTWTPWRVEIPEPTFEPPLYQGRLAIFNRFVRAAHLGEASRVAAARARKTEIEEVADERDAEIARLAAKAAKLREQARTEQEQAFAGAMARHRQDAKTYTEAFCAEQEQVRARSDLARRPGADGLLARIDLTLRTMRLPEAVPREAESRLDAESGVLIHEQRFPDLGALEWVKFVEQKTGLVPKPANQKERGEASAKVWPALCLRLACEISRLDSEDIVKAVAVNGWAEYTDKATGQRRRAYCASLFATKEQITVLNLAAVDPEVAFNSLKGIAARSLEFTPVAPIIRLDTNDPRFVDAKEVLARMPEGENLAAMDWEDFEHLCRELFERAFAGSGAEVKVTQASRDQGVDAIIFDPDPLRGGKIVIQAKRYTNAVDVSAVRDLYGAVINEGAIKGILVTTSYYGPDSYSFAKDKPLTLLAGRELLGLLEQHGYKFRIDLAEAKRMMAKGQ